MALPVEDIHASGAATTAARSRPAPTPAPARLRRQRRAPREHRSYRRALLLAALIAIGVGLVAFLLMRSAGTGVATVDVPSLVGRPLSEATRILEARDLDWTEKRVQSEKARDEVLDQDLREGLRVERGSVVNLTVSSGEPPQPQDVRVPDMRGLELDEAEDRLRQANLRVGNVIEEESNEVDAGDVLSTRPGSGSTVRPGSEVDIVVAKEPRKGKGRGND
jgi:beta-lactam-binding protein with PASTA domain